MNKGQMELFVKIAESGSFTQAGRDLNMTQPAVSRAISSLESELDVALLVRDRRGVTLTDVGKRILVEFRNILKGFDKVEQEIASEKGLEKGLISVGAFPAAAAYFLPKIIGSIARRYPGLEFRLFEGTVAEVREWLETGVIDAGILIEPFDGLHTFPLFKEKLYAVLPEGHRLAEKPVVGVKELENEPMVVCKSGYEPPVVDLFNRAGAEIHPKYVTTSYHTGLNLVKEGLASGLMSRLSLLSPPAGVVIREIDPPATRDIRLAVNPAGKPSIAVQVFIDTALERFAGSGTKDLNHLE